MSLRNVINEQTQFSDFDSILNNAVKAKQYGFLMTLFNLPNDKEISFKDLVSFLSLNDGVQSSEFGFQHKLPDLLKCKGEIEKLDNEITLTITLQMDLEDLFQYGLSKANLNENARQLSQDFFKTHLHIFKERYEKKIKLDLKFNFINESTFVKDSCKFDFSNIEEYFFGWLGFPAYTFDKELKTYYMELLIQQLKAKNNIVDSNASVSASVNANHSTSMSLLEHINHAKSCIENIWCFKKLLPIETRIQIIESETNIPFDSIADVNDFFKDNKVEKSLLQETFDFQYYDNNLILKFSEQKISENHLCHQINEKVFNELEKMKQVYMVSLSCKLNYYEEYLGNITKTVYMTLGLLDNLPDEIMFTENSWFINSFSPLTDKMLKRLKESNKEMIFDNIDDLMYFLN